MYWSFFVFFPRAEHRERAPVGVPNYMFSTTHRNWLTPGVGVLCESSARRNIMQGYLSLAVHLCPEHWPWLGTLVANSHASLLWMAFYTGAATFQGPISCPFSHIKMILRCVKDTSVTCTCQNVLIEALWKSAKNSHSRVSVKLLYITIAVLIKRRRAEAESQITTVEAEMWSLTVTRSCESCSTIERGGAVYWGRLVYCTECQDFTKCKSARLERWMRK